MDLIQTTSKPMFTEMINNKKLNNQSLTSTHQDSSPEHQQIPTAHTNTKKPANPKFSTSSFHISQIEPQWQIK